MSELHTNITNLEVFKGKDDQWYWRAKAGNHEIVATSEGYKEKFNALRAVQATFPSTIPVQIVESFLD